MVDLKLRLEFCFMCSTSLHKLKLVGINKKSEDEIFDFIFGNTQDHSDACRHHVVPSLDGTMVAVRRRCGLSEVYADFVFSFLMMASLAIHLFSYCNIHVFIALPETALLASCSLR